MYVVSYLSAQNTHKARLPVLLPFIHHPQKKVWMNDGTGKLKAGGRI